MKEAFIIDALRTPVGKFRGTLSPVRTDDLAALVLQALTARYADRIPLEAYDEVIMGCANQAGEDNRNVARMALLLAGIPHTVPGETVNRLCASSMSAAIHANRAIKTGDGDLFLVGGVEHMTRGPWVISKVSKAFGNDARMEDSSFGWRFVNPKMEAVFGTESMGQTAENLAREMNINRQDQDRFAQWSQQKAARAREAGRFAEEIISVPIPQRKADPIDFKADEFLKPQTNMEGLAKLRPAFRSAEEGGTVTAGNASGLNDGAGAMIVASSEAVKQYQLQARARIVSSAVVGVKPRIMGIGPVYAANKALKKAGMRMQEMDVIEINEAFAAQVLACTRQWGIADDDPRINPNGGAISIGHPLGMTGVRILQTATLELHKQQKRYALVTMCVGVGQGYATIIEKV